MAAYYLKLAGGDPDNAFLKRFEGHQPPVKKYSQCSAKGMVVRDNETGGEGLLFQITTITLLDDDTAQVKGGYYQGGLSASGNTYSLEKKEGRWIVVKAVTHWMSQMKGREESCAPITTVRFYEFLMGEAGSAMS